MKILLVVIGIAFTGLNIFFYFTPPYRLIPDFFSAFAVGFLSAALLAFLIAEASND